MTKTFILKNLNCAHCASIIEDEINKLNYVQSASLNFINKTIKITFLNNNTNLKQLQKLVDKIEPGVKIEIQGNQNIIEENTNKKLITIITGAILFVLALITKNIYIYSLSYIVLATNVILKALKNIFKGKIFDENFLMAIATIGAIILKEYNEAIAVMLFYQIGEFFQQKAVGNSRKAIKSLLNIKPDYANKENGQQVQPEQIKIDEIIIVKPGEKVPLDGVIVNGSSFLDMSALIGESVPKRVSIGDEVLSGSINNNGVLKIKVTKEYKNSTVAKILDLVQNASNKKSKTENFITKFAKIYTPIIVLCAIFLMIVPPIFTGFNFTIWFQRSLVFLVSSCPCALVISVPLSFFTGIGTASKRGILIKGSVHMQNLTEIDTIVFDKTGTITKGVFEITKICPINIQENEFLTLAYNLESLSTHPVAKSIVHYCNKNLSNINKQQIYNFEEISGYGIKANINDDFYLIGNGKLLKNNNVNFNQIDENGTIVYIAKNNQYLGYIIVSDIIKDNAKQTITNLKNLGIKKTVMLSGDKKENAHFVSQNVGIDEVYADLLPQDKVAIFEKLKQQTTKIAFVGDGINDAPVLAMSDVGISMGAIGSDQAIEASDIVITNDDLIKIKDSIIISKNTLKIVKSNIIFALCIKFSILILAVFGFATMWIGVFADVGVSVISILNAMRKKI